MPKNEALPTLLRELLQEWEKHPVSGDDYARGYSDGLAEAARGLRTALAQVNGLDAHPAALPLGEPESDAAWEYLYVTFHQADTGVWQLQTVNGVWDADWQDAPTFDEAVQRLRQDGGWRLTNFARGIHVFRRPTPQDQPLTDPANKPRMK